MASRNKKIRDRAAGESVRDVPVELDAATEEQILGLIEAAVLRAHPDAISAVFGASIAAQVTVGFVSAPPPKAAPVKEAVKT